MYAGQEPADGVPVGMSATINREPDDPVRCALENVTKLARVVRSCRSRQDKRPAWPALQIRKQAAGAARALKARVSALSDPIAFTCRGIATIRPGAEKYAVAQEIPSRGIFASGEAIRTLIESHTGTG
jgi:hypothetical protein